MLTHRILRPLTSRAARRDADVASAPLLVVQHLITAVWTALTTGIVAAVYRARIFRQALQTAD